MIDPKDFVALLAARGITFFAGVPDSLLKDLCAYVTANLPASNHVIAANEGGAVALAAGYHLATGKAALVYMQNSGTGNAINPLLSLADPDVYSIPMLVVIGWRGEPGTKDEPQHKKQGAVQEALLKSLGYSYEIMADAPEAVERQIDRLSEEMLAKKTPTALLVKKGSFGEYAFAGAEKREYPLSREEAIKIVLGKLKGSDRVVSTTGMASREIYELRDAAGEGHAKDFLTVGSMGHAIMIALGVAKFSRGNVYCIDGDGAAIMHLGSLGIVGSQAPKNLRHIVINNGSHDSVGGQPTIGYDLPFDAIAKDLGYAEAFTAEDAAGIESAMHAMESAQGPAFLEIRARGGHRKDLGRPKTTTLENKTAFMESLG